MENFDQRFRRMQEDHERSSRSFDRMWRAFWVLFAVVAPIALVLGLAEAGLKLGIMYEVYQFLSSLTGS